MVTERVVIGTGLAVGFFDGVNVGLQDGLVVGDGVGAVGLTVEVGDGPVVGLAVG